jgi:hypothetical protein
MYLSTFKLIGLEKLAEKGRIAFLPRIDPTTGLSSNTRAIRLRGVIENVMTATRTATEAPKPGQARAFAHGIEAAQHLD